MDNEIKKQNNNIFDQDKNWWRPAIKIFSQISIWIVVPIVSALFLGKYLDSYFNTKPVIFLSLALLGFLISSFGIFKIIAKYMEEISKLGEENKDK